MNDQSLDEYRHRVRTWCADNVPSDWRETQASVSDAEFVSFQKAWFSTLQKAGFAVPHWPAKWGGGMTTQEQIVLYQELASHDAPRLVLQFVAIHHAASTLLEAGTAEQQAEHLPAILDGAIWVQAFSEPEAGSDLASLRTTADLDGDHYVVNGQKVWASGAHHADWCLLLARTDSDAPKRRGISYFILDMTTPGIEIRPIKQSTGESHFCEMFLSDVRIPTTNLIGDENAGWQVANATLSAERGMTMLELAERLGTVGLASLVSECSVSNSSGTRPIDSERVRDQLASLETRLAGLRRMCRNVIDRAELGQTRPADASIVKLIYSELLQDLTNFGAEIAGVSGQAILTKPLSSGWESGAWVLDYISSWEWTIPGGASEIQRTIIGERGLGLPREPSVA